LNPADIYELFGDRAFLERYTLSQRPWRRHICYPRWHLGISWISEPVYYLI